jgi:hypothetical protein
MTNDEVSVRRGDIIAVSRLLWSIGSESTTSHQHQVDCWHWGAKLDYLSGLPPHSMPGQSNAALLDFYRDIRGRIDEAIAALDDDKSAT